MDIICSENVYIGKKNNKNFRIKLNIDPGEHVCETKINMFYVFNSVSM